MIELSEQSAPDYLRAAGRASPTGELLIQSLSGGVANIVLKVLDTDAGPLIGADLRTPDQITQGLPDTRTHQGHCFVLKQPLPKFKTEAEWLVDIDRILVERDCMQLLSTLLPADSVPDVYWFDDPNHILAISCAPTGAILWKKALLDGHVSIDAATHAGMLLAMLHSSTHNDPAVASRYGDPKFFTQQRIDPYLHATAQKHPQFSLLLHTLGEKLLAARLCLIHGDFSPKNIFLIPAADDPASLPHSKTKNPKSKLPDIARLFLLDFEVAFYGHPAFDVATLINHFLLKGFYHKKNWRPFMLLADNFWQTYRHTATPQLVRSTSAIAGHLLGALMLARIDGKSPAEYIIPDPHLAQQVRAAAQAILSNTDASLDAALDTISLHFDNDGSSTSNAQLS